MNRKKEYKVVKRFIDKHTRKLYEAGEKYECTTERFAELKAGNYIESLPEKLKKADE